MPPRYDVFISHAGEDKQSLAALIYNALLQRGISAFLDERELEVASDAVNDMEYAMQTASIAIFILSPEFALKYYPMYELERFMVRAGMLEDSGYRSSASHPRLIPVFYRLTVAECKYASKFLKVDCERAVWDIFNERAENGETSVKEVLKRLTLLTRLTGVKNENRIGNDKTKKMARKRKKFAETVCNEVTGVLFRRLTVSPRHEDWMGGEKDFVRTELHSTFAEPETPKEVVLELSMALEAGQVQTHETRVLREVLKKGSRIVGIIGGTGVGKSCILRAVAKHENVKICFPGGVYFISLGMEASIDTFRSELLRILHVSGGKRTAERLQDEENMDVISEEVGKLVGKERSLVLLDDVWPRNEVTERVISDVSRLFAEDHGGVVVFTTRFASVARAATDHPLRIEPQEALSETSRRILLNYAKFSEEEVERAGVEWVVEKLLLLADGLPAYLAAIGRTVSKLAGQLKGRKAGAWVMSWRKIRSRRDTLLREDMGKYKSFMTTLTAALQVLESNEELHVRRGLKYTWVELYRSLCVLKEQSATPVSVFRRMWQMNDEVDVEMIIEGFSSVGLGEIALRETEGNMWFMIHGLLNDFAMSFPTDERDSSIEGEISEWHQRLLDAYIQKGGVGVRKWWTLNDDGYIFENLCRHLVNSGATEELVGLLLSPEWTIFRHQVGGLSRLRKDFSECLDALEGHVMSEDREDMRRGLCLVRDAIGDCWTYVSMNWRELGFQVFGRLRDVEKGPAHEYLKSIEAWHPKPWLQPINRCLPKPGEAGRGGEFLFSNIVNDVALHEDPFFAVIGVGKEVVVIDLEGMQVRKKFVGHSGDVRKVWVSHDGERTLSWSMDRTVREWNLRTGEERVSTLEYTGEAAGDDEEMFRWAAFSTGGNYLAVGWRSGEVRVWDIRSGSRVTEEVLAFVEPILCVGMSADGCRIVTGGFDETMRVWDFSSLQEEGTFAAEPNDPLWCVACCTDLRQNMLRIGSVDEIRLRPVRTKTQGSDPLHVHEHLVTCVALTTGGDTVVSGFNDGIVRIWETSGGAQVGPALRGHSSRVVCVAVSSTRRVVVSGGVDSTLRITDLAVASNTGEQWHGHEGEVTCLAASADGGFFVSGSRDKTLRLWDVQSGSPIGDALHGHADDVSCVAISPDNQHFVSGSADKKRIVWNFATRSKLSPPMCGHTRIVNCLAYCPRGQFFVSGSDDRTMRISRIVDCGQSMVLLPARVWEFVRSLVRAVDGSVNGNESNILAHERDGRHESNISSEIGRCVDEYFGEYDSSVTCAVVSDDGRRIMFGLEDGSAGVWDVASRRQIGVPYTAHESCVKRLELFAGNEMISIDAECNRIRWKLDKERGLSRLTELECVDVDAATEGEHGERMPGRSGVICRGRAVQLSVGDFTLATLPSPVGDEAWHFNVMRRVLGVGMKNGRVAPFQLVE